MSLINQMLQDLDKRGSDALTAEPMYAHVRTLETPAPRRPWWLMGVPIVLLLALLAWLLWQQLLPALNARRLPPQVAAMASKAAARPAPIPAASVPTLAPTPAPLHAETLPQSASSADNLPAVSDLPLFLKLSSGIESPPPSAARQAEKNIPAPVLARIEKVTPEPAAKAEKSQAAGAGVAPLTLAKSAQQGAVVSKFVKETSPGQQAEGEYRQATVLQQQGRASEAIILLEQALKSDTQHAAARQLLIGLLLENKRHEDAMRSLQQGLSLDQNQPGLAMILARLQVEKGNLALAIETLQRTLPHAVERADYLAFLAALQQRGAHHKEAADLYQRALKKNPQNALWWMGLGISLQADARTPEALEAYARAKSSGGLSPELLAFVEQKLSALQH